MSTTSPFTFNLPKTTAANTGFSFGSLAAANPSGVGTTNAPLFGGQPARAPTAGPAAAVAPFSFGPPAAKPIAPSFGAQGFGHTVANTAVAPAAAPAIGFSYGSATTTATAAPFSFGAVPAATTTIAQPAAGAQPTFSFGLPSATGVGQPAFGLSPAPGTAAMSALPPANPAAPTAFGMFASPSTKPTSTATNAPLFNSTAVAPAVANATLGTGQPASTVPSLTGFTGLKTTATAPLSFGVGAAQPTALGKPIATTGFQLPQASTATATPVSSAFSSSLSAGSTLKFGLGSGSATTTNSFGTVASTLPLTSGTASATAVATSAVSGGALVPSTAAASAAVTKVPATITYSQLEEMINKWTHELDEQERYFSDEASRINSWDQALLTNGDKIAGLYEKVETCKKDQSQLEQEFDLIESQQRELDGLLEAVEKASNDLLPRSQLHSDFEREAVLQMASNVDLELGQLLTDLREMANQVNSTTSQDTVIVATGDSSASDGQEDKRKNNDLLSSQLTDAGPGPTAVQQVTRILNCHMQSLNWVHQNTQELMERVKAVENA